MNNDLLSNLDKVHTTELGMVRIAKNLGLHSENSVTWCKQKIKNANNIVRKGKNFYILVGDVKLTTNANNFTIITAHKEKIK